MGHVFTLSRLLAALYLYDLQFYYVTSYKEGTLLQPYPLLLFMLQSIQTIFFVTFFLGITNNCPSMYFVEPQLKVPYNAYKFHSCTTHASCLSSAIHIFNIIFT